MWAAIDFLGHVGFAKVGSDLEDIAAVVRTGSVAADMSLAVGFVAGPVG